jgi:hypothetical protein
MSRSFVSIWLFSALALLAQLGCEGKRQPTDAAHARSTLQRALDAWQSGEQFDAFGQSSPPVSINEPLWEKGTRLTKYDLQSTEKSSGFDKQFSVKLSLEDGSGKKFQEDAVYNVSTTPNLVIVRVADSE